MADRQTLLRFVVNDIQRATDEVNGRAGAVTVRLSDQVFVASMPTSFNPNLLTQSAAQEPNSLNDHSRTMLAHWRAVETSNLLTHYSQPNRRINMVRRGLAAIGLVVEEDIADSAIPRVLAGAHMLAREYASQTAANKLTLFFTPYRISSGSDATEDPPNVPPQIGAPPANMVSQSFISSWPSIIVFNNLLYCFYRGRGTAERNLFYSAFNGSSWTALASQVPNVVTSSAGPSTAVFNNKLYCFMHGNASSFDIWYTAFDGTSWESAKQVPNTRMTGGPSVVSFANKIYCFHQGWTNPSNALWYNVFDGSNWEGDKSASGSSITGSPAAVVYNNQIYCFYQGAGSSTNVLMVRVFTPETQTWDEAKPVPNSNRMVHSPSAVVVGGMLYCFHQGELDGELYANVSADGTEWGVNTLVDDVGLAEGLGAGVFNDELYYFFQRGSAGQETNGEMWYRKLLLAPDGDRFQTGTWLKSQGEPSLEELGYDAGYKGFIQMATDMQVQHSGTFGYVVYVTASSLLFGAYADETRMCLEYRESSIHSSIAKMFSAEGTFDQRLVNDNPNYPPRPVSQDEPRYTFAWSRDWTTIFSFGTLILFYRASNTTSNPHLWMLFWDRRNSRWVEMEGPRISPRSSATLVGAPAPQFGPSSRLFVFYHSDPNQEMRYNVLGIRNQMGERIWDVEKVMHDIQASHSPSPVASGQQMHVFHLGQSGNTQFRYTSLDTQVNHWTQSRQAYTVAAAGAPSAVHFLGKIYAFHKGGTGHNVNRLAFSIWDKDTLEWQLGTNNAVSSHVIYGEPAAVVVGDFVYVFYSSPASTVWWNRFNGANWRGPEQVPMTYSSIRPNTTGAFAACAWGDRIHCFFRNTSPTTMLIYKVFNTVDFSWEEEVVLPTAVGLSSKPGPILNQVVSRA